MPSSNPTAMITYGASERKRNSAMVRFQLEMKHTEYNRGPTATLLHEKATKGALFVSGAAMSTEYFMSS